jgi:hypothetical protein
VLRKGPNWEQPEVKVTTLKDGTRLDPDDQVVKKLHEEEDLEVADFLMVGLAPGEQDDQDGQKSVGTGIDEDMIRATESQIDSIMEDATS